MKIMEISTAQKTNKLEKKTTIQHHKDQKSNFNHKNSATQ